MPLWPEIPNPYLEAFAVGLLYGLIFCTSACLPYVTSYIAGIGAGFRKGVHVTLIYNSGRVTAYVLIGAAIGIFNGVSRLFINEASLSPFHKYFSDHYYTDRCKYTFKEQIVFLPLRCRRLRKLGREKIEQKLMPEHFHWGCRGVL